MRTEGHKAIAGPLRAAIWNWIDHFPDEFNDAAHWRGGKMEGAAFIFDFLYKKCAGAERTIWPALSILQCIIPERTSNLQAIGLNRRNQRLAKFTEDLLRQVNHPGKLWSISLACATDVCHAAIHIKPVDDEVSLQMLASDVTYELKVCGRISLSI